MKDYRKLLFVDRLKEFDRSTIYQERDIDITLDILITVLTQAMADDAPENLISIKGSTDATIDTEVLELIRKRNRVHFNSNLYKANPYLKSKYKEQQKSYIHVQ